MVNDDERVGRGSMIEKEQMNDSKTYRQSTNWTYSYTEEQKLQIGQEKRTYDKENLKLNCQQAHPSAQLPSPSVNDKPNCISFNISTLHRNVCNQTVPNNESKYRWNWWVHVMLFVGFCCYVGVSLRVSYLIGNIGCSKITYRSGYNSWEFRVLINSNHRWIESKLAKSKDWIRRNHVENLTIATYGNFSSISLIFSISSSKFDAHTSRISIVFPSSDLNKPLVTIGSFSSFRGSNFGLLLWLFIPCSFSSFPLQQ